MTLTVRLRPELESALELHCAERGVTKSLVVQEVLAEYLARPAKRRARVSQAASAPAELSDNYRAFEAAGLIGCVSGVGPADKAGVRAAFAKRLEAKKATRQATSQPAVTLASGRKRTRGGTG